MAQVTLTPTQLSAMETDGFIVLENLFDEATMAELDANLTAYQSRHEQDLIAAGGASGISRAGEILFTDHIAEAEDLSHLLPIDILEHSLEGIDIRMDITDDSEEVVGGVGVGGGFCGFGLFDGGHGGFGLRGLGDG
jgi:hypothetical protein